MRLEEFTPTNDDVGDLRDLNVCLVDAGEKIRHAASKRSASFGIEFLGRVTDERGHRADDVFVR